MRKTNALYLKTQRLIAETHRYTKRDTHTDAHRDTHRYTYRDKEKETHTKRHIKRDASEVYPSFCYTHES